MKSNHVLAPAVLGVVVSVIFPPWRALALTAVEDPHPTTRSFEHLHTLAVIRGSGSAHRYVKVVADPGEGWRASATGDFLQVDNQDEQHGNGLVQVRLSTRHLTGNGPHQGAVIITPSTGAEPITLPVVVHLWPPVPQDLTPRQLADPGTWPREGLQDDWELWSFLPDEISHPGSGAGQQIRAEERTPCPLTGPALDCTRPGQAGLAAGMSADRGWLLSTGDPRVLVAVLDSGIRWGEVNLVEKAYLNARELRSCPPPGAVVDDPTSFDVNGDGLFNIRDYDRADPPYQDLGGKTGLDPQDLIHGHNPVTGHPCSDGVDDDHNGFVDDISGWDFMWNDNDPSDDTDFGHGTGEANDSVGQGHDDQEGIGVCPRCTLLNVRVGDSFVADVNQFAEGVLFAVDSGASVILEALGTINQTPFMQAAIDYAWRHHVLVVASAADETSVHHNWPGNAEHVLNVHSITFDTDGDRDGWASATTFLNFCACTNYGAHLHLSTPGARCSSEATGKTAGQAGLVYSYYLQLRDQYAATGPNHNPYYDPPLTAAEVFQLLIMSADDIDVTGAEKDPDALALQKYVSNQGWDEAFGYGRNNVRRSLEMVRDKTIPPEVDISFPGYFHPFDPSTTPHLEVRGRVAVPRDEQARWSLQVARGIAPTESDWVEAGRGTARREVPFDGVLATLDLTDWFVDLDTPLRDRDARTLTLRLTATVTRGTTRFHGEIRKTISLLRDPQRRRALALNLHASGEASPRLTDLDGDGRDELLVALADGSVHAFRADGSQLPGWPVRTNRYPSISDEICNHPDPRVRLKCHRDARSYGSQGVDPALLFSSVVGTPAVGDLDGDGSPDRDVVAATLDGLLFAFTASGQMLEGFPVSMDPEHTAGFQWARNPPSRYRSAELGFFAAPVLVDLDKDGDLEIIAAGMDQWVYAWHHNGSVVNGWPVHCAHPDIPAGPGGRMDERIVATPTVADLDGDGTPEIVVGTGERLVGSKVSLIYAIRARGNAAIGEAFMPGWPAPLTGIINDVLPFIGRGQPNSAVAADVDGDGSDEIINTAMGSVPTTLDGDGVPFGAVPTMVQGSMYFGAGTDSTEQLVFSTMCHPTVADLDRDGRLDVVACTVGSTLAMAAQHGGKRIPYEHSISAWDLGTGRFLEGFPAVVEDHQFFTNYAVGDLDGDGSPEVVAGNGVYFVHAFNAQRQEPAGWPKNTMGWVAATPALGDLDGDNRMEVAVVTREGWLFVWDMPGRVRKRTDHEVPGPIQWAGFHHDDHGSGNLGTALRDYGVAPADASTSHERGACHCTATSTGPLSGITLLLAALYWWRRWRP